jgi:hypothetical protein
VFLTSGVERLSEVQAKTAEEGRLLRAVVCVSVSKEEFQDLVIVL